MNKKIVLDALKEYESVATDISRTLFKNPELSGEEYRSSKYLADIMAKYGFEVTRPFCDMETAFRAVKRGKSDTPKVAFFAEYDALPDIGHGCGHNMIASASVAAALSLGKIISNSAEADKVDGTVVLIGTPAEESLGGKIDLLRRGAFDDIDIALMMHPSTETRIDPHALASQSFSITFHGKPAHAAACPEDGINALDALVEFYISLDLLKKQLRKDVRLPGIITEGGVRANIVPERASGIFSARAADSAYLDYLLERIKAAAEGIASAHGARAEIIFRENRYEPMKTNYALADVFEKHLKESDFEIKCEPKESMGSLDMGNVSQKLPAIHPMVAIADNVPSHTREFADVTLTPRAERALHISARALALTAFEYFSSKDLARNVQKEFLETKI